MNAAIEKYLKEHPTKAAAGYDKAFFIRNPNGPEIFNFDFKFQNWFDDIESDPNNPPLGSSPLTPRQNSGTDTIRFRREELHFFGNLTDHIGYKIMVDVARTIGVDETAPQTNRILQDVFLCVMGKPLAIGSRQASSTICARCTGEICWGWPELPCRPSANKRAKPPW